MIRNIKNSSGKITGFTEITDDFIKISNLEKPVLIIDDKIILEEVLSGKIVDDTLIKLYNDYTISISEIASLYDRCYSNINKKLRKIEEIKFDSRGRRNRSYGKPQTAQTKQKISNIIKQFYDEGKLQNTPYERTPEIKQKISQSLKNYFKENPQNPEPHRQNWKNGIYDKVDFKRGIGGSFTSIKTNKKIHFRSLLELFYLLKIEEDPSILTYKYEPFHIPLENGQSYLPDFLINNKILVELKSKRFVEKVKEAKEKLEYKQSQAIKYCNSHNLEYKIIYDENLGFESRKMKHFINNNPDIVKKYHVTFSDPHRMV